MIIKTRKLYCKETGREIRIPDKVLYPHPEHDILEIAKANGYTEFADERMLIVTRDANFNILGVHEIDGNKFFVACHPSVLAAYLCLDNAANYAVLHNHPGVIEDACPSEMDLKQQSRYYCIGKLLNIPLNGAYVITPEGEYYDMLQNVEKDPGLVKINELFVNEISDGE